MTTTTTLKDILDSMHFSTKEERELIERAYKTAETAHAGQLRKSGEPYVTHPAAIGKMLAEMNVGVRTVAAGILHDVVEDTPVTSEDIEQEFGEEIRFLVDGVTKLGSVRYHGADRHNESLRRLFVATSRDIRVLIIKLVDRLHNMQTLSYVSKEKQLRIARETLEIYVPVANRLGMGRIRMELEDLAFPYVYPTEYEKVMGIIKPTSKHSDDILERSRKALQKQFAEMGYTTFKTATRVKGLYSLYHKLRRRDWNMDNIHDYLALRVVVKDVEQCYRALGIIHELWRPIPGRIKDYIAFPKPNGYRSLHTTVVTPYGQTVEIQIRTEDMHRHAEFGIASHIIYKNVQQKKQTNTKNESWFSSLVPSLFRPFSWKSAAASSAKAKTADNKNKTHAPHWIKEIAEAHAEGLSDADFAQDMRLDFFSQRIFAFTPKGDVVDLPKNATPIDFAYEIHSDIGNHINGALVNGKLVSIETELSNGDIINITTSKNAKPSQKWLDHTKSAAARRKIRAYLNDQVV